MRHNIHMTFLKTSIALLSLMLFGACAELPLAPRHPLDDRAFAQPILESHKGVNFDQPPQLTLLPGDHLSLELQSTQTTTAALLVEATGNVHVALAGDIPVVGLSLLDAEKRIKNALKRYDSLVQVTLTASALDGHRITVGGAVKTPSLIPLQPGVRLTDAIMQAGGTILNPVNGRMVSGSNLREARLTRNGVLVPVDFEKAMEGDPRHNVYLHGGDQIFIPTERANTIAVLGQVNGGIQPWNQGMRLTEALALAGGVHVGGDKADIRIIRGTVDHLRVYKTSLRDIVDGDSYDVELYPGDVVYVTDHWIEDVSEVTTALAPFISVGISAATLGILLR